MSVFAIDTISDSITELQGMAVLLEGLGDMELITLHAPDATPALNLLSDRAAALAEKLEEVVCDLEEEIKQTYSEEDTRDDDTEKDDTEEDNA